MPEEKLDVNISATAPFERLLIAAMEFCLRVRESMDKGVRDEWDRLLLEDYKRLRSVLIPQTKG